MNKNTFIKKIHKLRVRVVLGLILLCLPIAGLSKTNLVHLELREGEYLYEVKHDTVVTSEDEVDRNLTVSYTYVVKITKDKDNGGYAKVNIEELKSYELPEPPEGEPSEKFTSSLSEAVGSSFTIYENEGRLFKLTTEDFAAMPAGQLMRNIAGILKTSVPDVLQENVSWTNMPRNLGVTVPSSFLVLDSDASTGLWQIKGTSLETTSIDRETYIEVGISSNHLHKARLKTVMGDTKNPPYTISKETFTAMKAD